MQKKIAPTERDFFKQPFTPAELRALLKSLHLTAHDVVSTKSPSCKKLGLDERAVSEDELIALMAQEPRLIRRPLIVVDGQAIIGFDKSKLMEVLKR